MSGTGKKRTYRKKEFWQAEIEKFRFSGQSMSDYCRENNLATSTFTRKLQILDGDKTIPAKPTKNKPSFIEVKTAAMSTLRVNLPTGISIDVPEAYSTSQLSRIIELCRS